MGGCMCAGMRVCVCVEDGACMSRRVHKQRVEDIRYHSYMEIYNCMAV